MQRESLAVPVGVWAVCLALGLLLYLALPFGEAGPYLAVWFAAVWLGMGLAYLMARPSLT